MRRIPNNENIGVRPLRLRGQQLCFLLIVSFTLHVYSDSCYTAAEVLTREGTEVRTIRVEK